MAARLLIELRRFTNASRYGLVEGKRLNRLQVGRAPLNATTPAAPQERRVEEEEEDEERKEEITRAIDARPVIIYDNRLGFSFRSFFHFFFLLLFGRLFFPLRQKIKMKGKICRVNRVGWIFFLVTSSATAVSLWK